MTSKHGTREHRFVDKTKEEKGHERAPTYHLNFIEEQEKQGKHHSSLTKTTTQAQKKMPQKNGGDRSFLHLPQRSCVFLLQNAVPSYHTSLPSSSPPHCDNKTFLFQLQADINARSLRRHMPFRTLLKGKRTERVK